MALFVVVKKLDLHLGHIDPGGAFALAAFARHAQIHGLIHFVGGKRIRPQLARQRQPQRVGTPAREMLLVARDSERRTHRARIKLAAMAVVVAHLNRFIQPAPFVPIQRGFDRNGFIARLEAEQRAIILLRRAHDFTGVEQAFRIKNFLNVFKGLRELWAEERRDPFAAHQPVAMLAGIRAFVLFDHLGGFFGDGAHFARAVFAHVQNRPHVQRAH